MLQASKVRGPEHSTSRCLERTSFDGPEGLLVQHLDRLLGEGAVQRHHVALREQLLQSRHFRPLLLQPGQARCGPPKLVILQPKELHEETQNVSCLAKKKT